MPDGGAEDDPLAHAMLWLLAHHGKERSLSSLLTTQQVNGLLSPDQAVRALREAGFNAGLVQRPIDQINEMLLPAVLLLNNGDACIFTHRQAQAHGPMLCTVLMPGPNPQELQAGVDELTKEYSGIVMIVTPKARAAKAVNTLGMDGPQTGSGNAGHWLWGTMRRFVPYYRSAMVAALLSNVLMLVIGLITSVIFDKVIPHQAFTTLWALATAGALALIFDFASRQLRGQLIDMAGRKCDMLVGVTLFRQSLAVRMEHRPDSAGAYAHIVGQIEMVREFFSSASLSALSDLPFIVIFIAMTFVIGGPLGLVLVAAVPLILGAAWMIQGQLRRATSNTMRQQADLHGVLVEAVEGIEDIKATGAQGRFLQAYEASTAAAIESQLRSRRLTNWTMNLSAVSQQMVTLILLVWGVYLIDQKVITGGALMGAVMFGMRAIAPLTSVVMLATRYQGAKAAMRALDHVMSQPVERDANRNYLPQRERDCRVALNEVGFAYPASGSNEAPKVLKGVNLKFEPGERVAILGRIGSGKSTVLRLLAGLYEPTEGQVEVNGIDLRQIDPYDFRAQVGYVPQDPRLFTGTLRDNVLLGRAAADASRLGEVARLTGLARVAENHPMGWDLPVGESGALLSGGQRQLVALTRCLITQPRIVLMDEPTSSMDAQSELAFLRQLNQATEGCTLVMVTHRPAVLELVKRIVVIDSGKLVMDGPKAQVLAALSGAKPTPNAGAPAQPVHASAVAGAAAASNVHLHPRVQPDARKASV